MSVRLIKVKSKKMKNQDSLIGRVLKSIFFKKATSRAAGYTTNKNGLLGLLKDTLLKSNALKGVGFDGFRQKVATLTRMLRAYTTGQYRTVPVKTLVSIIAALLYFVSPIDVIPDLLPIIGLTDDVALILWLFRSLSTDIEAFEAWEGQEKIIPIG